MIEKEAGKKQGFRGSKPGERRGGRKPGVPNRATTAFRDTVTKLLEDNAQNVSLWLAQVAADDPDKALQRLAQLAEYAAPKLSRSEVKAEVDIPVSRIQIEVVRAGTDGQANSD